MSWGDRLPFTIGSRPIQGDFDELLKRFRDVDDYLKTWKPLPRSRPSIATLTSAPAGATYHALQNGGAPIVAGNNYAASGSSPGGLATIEAASLAVPGKKAQLRLSVVTLTNGTDDGRVVTHGLYPITASGAAGLIAVALGTVVAGSQVAVNSGTNDERTDTSGVFDLPADGPYIIGLILSGAGVANSIKTVEAFLEIRHIDA